MNPRRRQKARQRRKWIIKRWEHAGITFVGYYRRTAGSPYETVTTSNRFRLGSQATSSTRLCQPFRTDQFRAR